MTGGGAGGSGGVGGNGGGNSGAAGGQGGSAGMGSISTVRLPIGDGELLLEGCADNVVRVAYASDPAFFTRATLATEPKQCPGATWTQTDSGGLTTLDSGRLKVQVDTATGQVSFLDPLGNPILAEAANGGRTLSPVTVQGETTNNVRQEWQPNADEALYGLGQQQLGLLNIKGYDLDLKQYNTTVTVPFLVSSRGYGVLWDNTSFSRFGDLGEPAAISGAAGLYDGQGQIAGRDDGSVDWQGEFQVAAAGEYVFHAYSAGQIRVTVDGQVVIDHWRQGWLPGTDVARVHLEPGAHDLRLEWTSDIGVNIVSLLWKTPPPSQNTSLWSEVGDGVDYYFVYGPELDDVVAGYRQLTGKATLMPRWAFGLWQSRERYTSAQDVLDVLDGFRSRGIPVDNIVQDWQYWEPDQWGSHAFDASRFPNADDWIQSIHDDYDARLMVSVWPKFYTATANYAALNQAGFTYQPNVDEGVVDFVGHPFTYYDAFDADARQLFWSQIEGALFNRGVDAWWADGVEPDIVEGPFETQAEQLETFRTHMHPTALGSGARVLNAYPLVNSRAFYEGQRGADPDRRVFILTRSAFAGQQRYAAATWSGDITSTWTAFKKQIPAGLNFSVAGIPYWTVDSGGFAVPPRFASNPTADAVTEWRELNTRWFQYATFLPLLRVHGQAPLREMWEFGGDASESYQAQLKFDRLRYRMLPYVYSLAGAATHHGGTILRPLVMDFRIDPAALDIDDQYLFGPAFLVSPVTDYQARSRAVYLPQAAGWYDFWTGEWATGGQTVDADAPYDAIPIHVRAGSIIPFGPELTYTNEKLPDLITLYVYAGADGTFSLYEDDGETYGYENDEFSTIDIGWNDATRTLTIGARQGSFPGMLQDRTFEVVLVSESTPVGFSFTPTPAATVAYSGAEATVQLD